MRVMKDGVFPFEVARVDRQEKGCHRISAVETGQVVATSNSASFFRIVIAPDGVLSKDLNVGETKGAFCQVSLPFEDQIVTSKTIPDRLHDYLILLDFVLETAKI